MKANLFLVGGVSSDPKVARPRKTNPRKVGTHKEAHTRVLNKLETSSSSSLNFILCE
jgi:hypothetical protein